MRKFQLEIIELKNIVGEQQYYKKYNRGEELSSGMTKAEEQISLFKDKEQETAIRRRTKEGKRIKKNKDNIQVCGTISRGLAFALLGFQKEKKIWRLLVREISQKHIHCGNQVIYPEEDQRVLNKIKSHRIKQYTL